MERRLVGLVRVSDQGGQDIDHGVDDTPMARVLDLLDVFKLIVDAFDDRALAQSQLLHQWHEFVLQVLADLGDQVQTTLPAFVEEALRHVASIRDELAGQALGQVGDGLAIIDVARRDPKREQLATVVDDEVELEAVEPAHGMLTAPRDLLEHLVTVDPAVVTNDPSGRIGEGDAGIRAMTRLERHTERHQRTRDQRDNRV